MKNKKQTILAIILATLLVFGMFFTFAAPNFDLNGDGSVTVADISSLAQLYRGKGVYNASYDFNNDSEIDLFDLVRLAKNVSTAESSNQTLHPSEPSGFTEIGWADGSIAEEPAGTAFGVEGWDGWGGYSGGGSDNVYVVDDSENPTGSGKAVRFFWNGSIDEAAFGNLYHPEGNWTEIYIAERFVYRHPNGTGGDFPSHKFYYHQVEGGATDNAGPWPTHEGGQITFATSCGQRIIDYRNAPLDQFDTEILMEWHWIAPSSFGVSDGEVYVYIDGELVDSNTGVDTSCYSQTNSTFWDGIHFYMRANEWGEEDFYMDVREFYVSGKE